MTDLEPMPVEGPVALFSCLPYWFSVVSARMKRSSVVGAFRREILADEKKLDEILRDLGKSARTIGLQHPATDGPMTELHQLESERAQLETDTAGLTGQVQQAEGTFETTSADCDGRIQAAQQSINETQTTLNQKNTEIRALKGQLAQIDKERHKLAAALRSKSAQGAKAQEADKQAALEQEADQLTVQIEAQEKGRDGLQAQVAELEGPINELNTQLADAKTRLQEAQKELAAARQELANTKRSLGAEEQKKGQEMTRLDQAMAQKFLDIGKLLDQDRVADPSLEELYGRIDEAKDGIQNKETHAAALSAERDNFDRGAAQKGLILMLSMVGAVVLVAITLIILFVFVFD